MFEPRKWRIGLKNLWCEELYIISQKCIKRNVWEAEHHKSDCGNVGPCAWNTSRFIDVCLMRRICSSNRLFNGCDVGLCFTLVAARDDFLCHVILLLGTLGCPVWLIWCELCRFVIMIHAFACRFGDLEEYPGAQKGHKWMWNVLGYTACLKIRSPDLFCKFISSDLCRVAAGDTKRVFSLSEE